MQFVDERLQDISNCALREWTGGQQNGRTAARRDINHSAYNKNEFVVKKLKNRSSHIIKFEPI